MKLCVHIASLCMCEVVQYWTSHCNAYVYASNGMCSWKTYLLCLSVVGVCWYIVYCASVGLVYADSLIHCMLCLSVVGVCWYVVYCASVWLVYADTLCVVPHCGWCMLIRCVLCLSVVGVCWYVVYCASVWLAYADTLCIVPDQCGWCMRSHVKEWCQWTGSRK